MLKEQVRNKILKLKGEKGAITIYVLAVMLFLISIMALSYMGIANKNQSQRADIKKIQQEYEKQVQNIDELYEEVIAKNIANISFEYEKTYNIASGTKISIPVTITLTVEPENESKIITKEYAWGESTKVRPTSWTALPGNTVTTTNANVGEGKYCVWVKITTDDGTIIYKSTEEIVVNEEEIEITKDE